MGGPDLGGAWLGKRVGGPIMGTARLGIGVGPNLGSARLGKGITN